MGEFAEEFDCLRHSLPFIELEPNFELISQLEELNGSVMESPCIGLMSYSSDYCLPQQSEFIVPVTDNLSGFLPVECQKAVVKLQTVAGPIEEQIHGDRKRKTMAISDTNSRNYSELHSEAGLTEVKNKKKNFQGSRMRSKSNPKEVDKPRQVVHVRAGRGQATDSHSLAERERRKKISERMKRLQEQVPGCYKEMGMARMLDEIIRYVQSLQNQVEFLSMELSAASYSHDHRLGAEALATPQVDKTQEEAERVIREGYGECSSFHSSVPF